MDGILQPEFSGRAYNGGVSYDWVHMGSALSGNTAAYFDDVFVGPVPEPTTVALVSLGGLFLGARYLRRGKRFE